MKKNNYFVMSIAAIAVSLMFVQCAGKNESPAQSTTSPEQTDQGTSIKIAFVEIDSLITKYNFWSDLSEQLMKREENMRATLNQKEQQLRTELAEFQRKVQNRGFLSQERAQSEEARLIKMQEDLQALSNRLQTELGTEGQKNSIIIRDSINSFLRDYNKDKKYDFIFSKSGMENVLYANSSFNITNEVVTGLNARYRGSQK